ncbi:MAG: hypothetical protein LBT39_02055, partial [Treponema sp.]|nr:hypothetical protein [Treponema sp.]
MNSKEDQPYFKLTGFLILFVVAVYGIFRFIDFYVQGYVGLSIISASFYAGMVVLILLFRRFNRIFPPAFFEPLLVFLFHIFVSVLQGSFEYFFLVSIVVCCFAAVYMDRKKLMYYILASNLVTLVLVILKIPNMRLNGAAIQTEILEAWILEMAGAVFIYQVIRFATDKRNKADMAEDSFSTMLAATPNVIVLLDSANRTTYISKAFVDMARLENAEAAIGRPVLDLLNDTAVKNMFTGILSKAPPYEDTQRIMLNDKPHYFRVIATALQNETKSRGIELIDIT